MSFWHKDLHFEVAALARKNVMPSLDPLKNATVAPQHGMVHLVADMCQVYRVLLRKWPFLEKLVQATNLLAEPYDNTRQRFCHYQYLLLLLLSQVNFCLEERPENCRKYG